MAICSDTEAAERLARVRVEMAAAARLCGRKVDTVNLIAVAKTHDGAAVEPFLRAGQREFAENRVAEATSKWPALRAAYPDIRLHLVGQLQSNKADEAVMLFDAIHSVDRPSLVAALARAMQQQGKLVDCFVQVNIGDEPQKGGCALGDLSALLALAGAAGLPLVGLMCVPPQGCEPAPFLQLLRKLSAQHGLAGLSMGMSDDFATAITLGATHIRVGSALFGVR